ncbi:MAG: 50S ribosomal protein L6 [bacterium]|nr:50S ribosomal protein L6 [bacterium]MDT8395895.1 50S ribosomal protein L6 [bacterium]
MSRIGKQPIPVPGGVDVKLDNRTLTVKGPRGFLIRDLPLGVDIEIDSGEIRVLPPSRPKEKTAFQGLTRSLIHNMVVGVSEGYKKELDMVGVGYRAMAKGRSLEIHVGFSHPVDFNLPDGITADVDKSNRITVEGIDKEKVGQTAADIRALRPPEPYKGKGIMYVGEKIRRKAGKTGV